jgi:tight adherence protein B
MLSDLYAAIDPGWLLFAGVFLGVLLLAEGLRELLSRRETDAEARARRMRGAAPAEAAPAPLSVLAPRKASRVPAGRDLAALLGAGGLPPRPGLIGGLALAGAGLVALALQPFLGLLAALLAALLLCLVAPFMILVSIRQSRLARIAAQLPDALDLMARGLKAGHPLNTSITIVADTMPDPIGAEFRLLVDQVSYGDDVVTAVRKLAQRNPTEDFQYFAASVGIQHGSGGNLGRVLTVLAQVMRGRAMMRRKIHAMSAEGRISAFILSGLPFVMFGLNMVITPEYYGGVINDPLFPPMAAAAVGLVALNALVLFRLVRFRF